MRDLVTTAAGADAIVDDPSTANVDEAMAAVPAVAIGYAQDTDNSGKNAQWQARIGRTSSVKAPE